MIPNGNMGIQRNGKNGKVKYAYKYKLIFNILNASITVYI